MTPIQTHNPYGGSCVGDHWGAWLNMEAQFYTNYTRDFICFYS